MPSFSSTLEAAIHNALGHANQRKHELATLEHLLLALIDEPDAVRVMKRLRRRSGRSCARTSSDQVRGRGTRLASISDIEGSEAAPTTGFQRVIQRAAIHVQSSGRTEVTGANVLVAIFAERESHAAYFLQEQDMTRLDAVNYISHGVAKAPGLSASRGRRGGRAAGGENQEKRQEKPRGKEAEEDRAVRSTALNLNEKARKGNVDPLIGRERTKLSAASRCSAAGARTTRCWWAIRAWARPRSPRASPSKIVDGEVPEVLAEPRSSALDMGSAARRHTLSRRFRGAAEGRDEGAGRATTNAILFIDEIHTVIGAGATSGGARWMRPTCSSPRCSQGTLRCMGSTTYKEYRQHFEKDRALSRRFQKIDVNEPTRRGCGQDPEGPEALFRGAPQSATRNDAIRSGGGPVGALHPRPQAARQGDRRDRRGRRGAACCCPRAGGARLVTSKEIEAVVAKIARIPPKNVSKDDSAQLLKT
jgi:ATP-dependent Clp protease ATP-binding subunit ClpA